MTPIASPETARAIASTRTLWHKGMMANITEMMRAEMNKAARALSSLQQKKSRVIDETLSNHWCARIDLRFPENTTNRAADQQAELLSKENPGNLTERRVGLRLQIQNCGSQESNAESKAEEKTPIS